MVDLGKGVEESRDTAKCIRKKKISRVFPLGQNQRQRQSRFKLATCLTVPTYSLQRQQVVTVYNF